MSRLICAFVVRIWHKQVFSWRGSYTNNTGTNQPAHLHSLISAFVVRCVDSLSQVLQLLYPKFWLVSVAEQVSFSLSWSNNCEQQVLPLPGLHYYLSVVVTFSLQSRSLYWCVLHKGCVNCLLEWLSVTMPVTDIWPSVGVGRAEGLTR